MIDSWDNHRNVISCVLTARHHLIISFLFMHIKNVRQLVYRLQVQHINKYNGVVIWTRKQNEKLVKPHFFQDNPGENPGETTQVRKPRWDNPSEKIQVRQPRWDNPKEMIQVRQPRWDNPGEIIQVRQPRWDNPGELASNQSKYTSPTVITFITNLSALINFLNLLRCTASNLSKCNFSNHSHPHTPGQVVFGPPRGIALSTS